MQSAPLRTATALVAFAAFLPFAALAAPKPFVGPSGWDHTVGAVSAQSPPRSQETWKKSDGQQLIYLTDGGLAYDDIVAMVKKNITDNTIKTAVDKDRTCDGHRAHEVEMTFAPTVVHQIIIDNTPGVTKLTYTRPDGMAMSADATAAIAAYCGP
jgi:hypothetical protein